MLAFVRSVPVSTQRCICALVSVAPVQSASVKSASSIAASTMCAWDIVARTSLAFCRIASVSVVEVQMASVRSAPPKSAFVATTFAMLEQLSLAPPKVACCRLVPVPVKFVRSRFAPSTRARNMLAPRKSISERSSCRMSMPDRFRCPFISCMTLTVSRRLYASRQRVLSSSRP